MATNAHDSTKNKPATLDVTSGAVGAYLVVNYRLTTKRHRLHDVECDREALTITAGDSTLQVESEEFFDDLNAARERHLEQKAEREQRMQDRRQARADVLPSAFTEVINDRRWQYAVINTGTFNTGERLQEMLSHAGAAGWELVTVYDKSSNWLVGLEKGFMLMKRPIPPGAEPAEWCVMVRADVRLVEG